MTPRPESPRKRRVAERIQMEIAEILTREAEDPRLRSLTVTGARVSRDLASARVWVSGRMAPADEAAILAALEHAAPYFRTLLAPRLGLRIVPTLRFEFDHTMEAGLRIEELLREIKDQDDKDA
ncbi:MAG TPA: 30S ribosome-binding factor RbfA [Candidatus Limnocylindrales bacterium]|jgi:ribosome-binding factor A|nr:30S ribosome-binding factor RbfA [Candidatus Limnocylindrales bacterium]